MCTRVEWIEGRFERRVSRETLRRAPKRLGFSWKKAKALLNRASTAAREAFVERLQEILQRTLGPQPPWMIYLDEAHLHQDTDLGDGWAPTSERLWVDSHSPGLSANVSFYGRYVYLMLRKSDTWPVA